MDEKETRGGGMPLAYIHAFAYFFFSEGKMQFSPRGDVGDGGRGMESRVWNPTRPRKDFMGRPWGNPTVVQHCRDGKSGQNVVMALNLELQSSQVQLSLGRYGVRFCFFF